MLPILKQGVRSAILPVSCLTILFFLGPFPMEGGPIRTYYHWTGTPFVQTPILGALAAPARLIICVATLLTLRNRRSKGPGESLYPDLAWIACVGFFSAWIASSSLREAPWALSAAALFCGWRFLAPGQKVFVTRLALALLVMQLLVCVWAYLADFRQLRSPGIGKRASGLLESPNSIYPLAMFGFFLFMGRSIGDHRRYAPLVRRSLSLLALVVLAATFSRAGWLGLAAGAAYLSRSAPRWRAALSALALTLLVGAVLVRGGGATPWPRTDRSVQGHILSVEAGLRVLPGFAVTGGGPHAFVNSNGYDALRARSARAPWEPKCLPLHIALEYGVPGLLVALVGLAAVWKTQSAAPGRALLIAMSVAGISDTPVFANLTTMPATVLLILLLDG